MKSIFIQELHVEGTLLGDGFEKEIPAASCSYRLADLCIKLLHERHLKNGVLEFYADCERFRLLSTLMDVQDLDPPLGYNENNPVFFTIAAGNDDMLIY